MWWQKLLIEWPVQFLRQLWADPSALVEKITWRKIVFVAAFVVAAYLLAQIVSLDMAFLMAGDMALYCEIAGALMFVVVRGHIRQSVHAAKLAVTHAARRGGVWFRRRTGARRRREIKAPTASGKGADNDGGWLPELRGFAFQS